MLSICGNDFIAHWAYEEKISSHTEHRPNEFSRMLSQRKNVNSFYMYRYAEHTGKWFYPTLSIQGNDLNAGWAYMEMISSLTENMRKCLKVEYLSRIEYDFQKSRVTGPWDPKDSVPAKKSLQQFHACWYVVGQHNWGPLSIHMAGWKVRKYLQPVMFSLYTCHFVSNM